MDDIVTKWLGEECYSSLTISIAGYPVINDPLYNHEVFGPAKGRGGDIGGKSDEQLVKDLINIHNAENWLGIDGDSEMSLFKSMKPDAEDGGVLGCGKGESRVAMTLD